MDDQGHFHMMLEDMERLERVHYHHKHPDIRPTSQQQPSHNPWVSGLRVMVNDAVRSGLEKLHTFHSGRG